MLNIMDWNKVTSDAINGMQFDSGIIVKDFDPSDPALPDDDDLIATTGAITATCKPNIVDLGSDVNNLHVTLAELQYISSWECTLAFTALEVSESGLAMWLGASDTSNGVTTPRAYLKIEDFTNLWWIGFLVGGGIVAIKLKNALNTGGMTLSTGKDEKGNLSVTMTGYATVATQSEIPMEFYMIDAADVSLASLVIGSVALSPTFNSSVTSYTATTTSSTNTITATATDSAHATVTIKNGTTTVTSGSSATWVAGQNTVKVTVTNGNLSRVYTVTVTKS